MIRRINVFGGPGIGKSTTAAHIFYELKKKNLEVDWIQESAKQWTYLERKPLGWSDQFHLFAKNLHEEEVALRKLQYVVCDAPMLMHCYYSKKANNPYLPHLIATTEQYEKQFPSLNLFLTRGNWEYSNTGRFQTEIEAKKMDQEIKEFLEDKIELINYSNNMSIFSYLK